MSNDTATRCLKLLENLVEPHSKLREIAQGGDLREQISLDSLTMVNLIVSLENEFKFSFEAENLDEIFANFNSLVAYIDSQLT